MNQTIRLSSIKCVEEINEASESEEPYVLVTSVSLRPSDIAGLPPVPNFEVVRYGIFEDFDAGEVRQVSIEAGPPFWGPSSTPEDIQEPGHAAIVVSLIENDNANPEQYQSLLRAVVPISLASSLGEPDSGQRAARLTNAIRDALNGVELPFPFALDDDHIGTQQLRLDASDLLAGGAKDKTVTIQSAEGHYELGFRITAFQPAWRFCGKCKSLFFDGDAANKGTCAVGGGHEAAGFIFALMHDGALEPNLQSDWRFCGKCRTLFFDGDAANKGACPVGGGHEAAGFNFALLHDIATPANHQPDWRFCGKCMALFFGAEPNKGVCPRPAPSSHEALGNNFFLPFDSPGPNRQPEWRFCGKCKSMFFNGDPAQKGACPVGGGHEAIGFNFFLPFDSPGPNRQPEWRFCGKCMTLFFDGDATHKGACPVGGGHAAIGNNFFLPFDSPGPSHQSGWRFCGKCMTMFFDGEPNKGVCSRPALSTHEAIGANFVLSHS